MAKTLVTTVPTLIGILAFSIAVGYLLKKIDGSLADWVQAIGAIAAITAGFAMAADQQHSQEVTKANERREFTRAAQVLTHAALQTVSERLDTALQPRHPLKVYALQGDRTTEMVRAMAELDTALLPSEVLPFFIQLRSYVFAVNSRISEVYDSEKRGTQDELDKKRARRPERLKSSLRVHDAAIKLFIEMQSLVVDRYGHSLLAIKTGPSLNAYPRPSTSG
ncbi:hypothetical protein [Rhizobium ruizarguesonis]|uniref:hypothetical protein n=1 Tax=Rhizobium ruizarguesonis TaxID=2081791 RepID=UPI00102F82DA|nr:hypothetical protein [Rhizobium ruizarguesonis]TBC48186.1 hypothetical protein ELH32_29465 [Rhizobium ruizarguesonis]